MIRFARAIFVCAAVCLLSVGCGISSEEGSVSVHPARDALNTVMAELSLEDALEYSTLDVRYYCGAEDYTQAHVTVETHGYLDDTFSGHTYVFEYARTNKTSPWRLLNTTNSIQKWPPLTEWLQENSAIAPDHSE